MQPSCIFAEADQVLQGLIILSSYTDTALELTDLWDIICPSVCSINDSELTQFSVSSPRNREPMYAYPLSFFLVSILQFPRNLH